MATLFATLLLLLVATASWGGVGWLVFNVPPSRPLAVITLYVLAFAGIASTAALVAWAILRPAVAAGGRRPPTAHLGHAMLLAGIALFGLWLQSLRMLSLTVALLLAGLFVFLELALLFGTRGAVDVEIPTRVPLGAAES